MIDEPRTHAGPVSATPEGGPLAEGVPASAPGAGQVRLTPEAGPLSQDAASELTPPTLRDHMQGPILGLDDAPTATDGRGTSEQTTAPAAVREEPTAPEQPAGRTPRDDEELGKWPPYSGKPVSEVRWDALRYAAPVVAQAEKLAIRAIDLSGKGLSRLAHVLEERRAERGEKDASERDQSR